MLLLVSSGKISTLPHKRCTYLLLNTVQIYILGLVLTFRADPSDTGEVRCSQNSRICNCWWEGGDKGVAVGRRVGTRATVEGRARCRYYDH